MVAKRATSLIAVFVSATLCGLDTPRAEADLVISIEGECPGVLGVSWKGAAPLSRAGMLTSRNRGPWIVPGGPCGGTLLNIDNPAINLRFQTDADGVGSFEGFVPETFCGKYLQMVVADDNPCQTSNVVQIQ